MANRWGKNGNGGRFVFLSTKISVDGDCSHEIKRCLLLRIKAMTNLDSMLKSMRHHFAKKDLHSQSYSLSSSHVRMWELYHKEGWVLKNWCFWNTLLEKALESLLDGKKNKSVNPKGNQPWIFTGKTNAEAEAPILWTFDEKSWLFGKDPDVGKDWRQEKRATEDEMVEYHHRLNRLEFEQTPGGQRSLVCYSPWGHRQSYTT